MDLAPSAAAAALDNASDLLRSSELIAADGKPGLAVALVIAAIEEIGKALGLELQIQLEAGLAQVEPSSEEERVTTHHQTAVFDDHQLKKFLCFSFIPSLAVYRALGVSTAESSGDVSEQVFRAMDQLRPVFEEGRPPSSIDQEKQPLAHALLDFLVQTHQAALDFEQLRQRGFYVDVRGKTVLSPRRIPPRKYRSLNAYAKEAQNLAAIALAKGLPKQLLRLLVAWVEQNATVTIVEYDEKGEEVGRRTRRGLKASS